MTLWDKLEEIRSNHLNQEVEFQLFYNDFKITDFIPLPSLRLALSLDILELPSTDYIIEDITKENAQIKALTRYIKVHIKKGNLNNDVKRLN